MCVSWTSEWYEAKETLTVYKAMRKDYNGEYVSFHRADQRHPQSEEYGTGCLVKYTIGKSVASPKPGLYCYFDLDRRLLVYKYYCYMIRCEIPRGTLVREGMDLTGIRTINCLEMTPVVEVRMVA